MHKTKHIGIGLFTALALCFLSYEILAAESKFLVKKIHFTGKNKIEVSLSTKSLKPDEFKVFTLTNPNRLVIDISNATFEKPDYKPLLPFFVSGFRSKLDQTSLRLVFDLTQKISLQKIWFDKESGKIIGEISGIKIDDEIEAKVEEFDVQTTKIVNADGSAKYIIKKTTFVKAPETKPLAVIRKKIPVIVIDAGHGGKDPGTIGEFARTKEKNLTLSYAKELAKQLANSRRYKVYLTRNDDFFIPLRERIEKARKQKADLFISLHANAISDRSVSGFSIYTLSENSSDKQAELLAQKENRADIINGVDFSKASRDVMKTLIDLSQRESKNNSASFANIAIKSVKASDINILQNTHRFAGFAVLTAPDMCSTLIELGYLSNKHEEELLNSLSYKRKVAASLLSAIDEYFSRNKI